MEPTYAHTCVKGIKLAAGELSDSTEEEEVEAMEMYARLAEAEDPRDFEQTLQANIEAMQAMQAQVQRRASALDAAFDAAVGRLNGACTDAIAQRRAQAATASPIRMPPLPAA